MIGREKLSELGLPENLIIWASNLDAETAYNTCYRPDWLLMLFHKTNDMSMAENRKLVFRVMIECLDAIKDMHNYRGCFLPLFNLYKRYAINDVDSNEINDFLNQMLNTKHLYIDAFSFWIERCLCLITDYFHEGESETILKVFSAIDVSLSKRFICVNDGNLKKYIAYHRITHTSIVRCLIPLKMFNF